MANSKNTQITKSRLFLDCSLLFLFGSWIYFFSSIHLERGIGLYIEPLDWFLLPYLLFGLLTALLDYSYHLKPFLKEKNPLELVYIFSLAIAYSGIYKLLMLPSSGLLVIEMLSLAVILFLLCGKKVKVKIGKNIVIEDKNPNKLIIPIIFFFLIKLFVVILNINNPFRDLLEDNLFYQWILTIYIILFAFLGFVIFYRRIIPKNKGQEKKDSALVKGFKGFLLFIKKSLKAFFNLLTGLLSAKVLIILILALLAIFGIFGGFTLHQVRKDASLPIIKILEVMFSTGLYGIYIDTISVIGYTLSIILFVIFCWKKYSKNALEIEACEQVKEIESLENENIQSLSLDNQTVKAINYLLEEENNPLLLYEIQKKYKELEEDKINLQS
ncbi:MAG: hypothetical protein K5866_04900 [Treponema sp.]|nr:hypothetical protein [Treponema sp.]